MSDQSSERESSRSYIEDNVAHALANMRLHNDGIGNLSPAEEAKKSRENGRAKSLLDAMDPVFAKISEA